MGLAEASSGCSPASPKGLVSAKAVAEAVRAYHQEMNRRNQERRAQTDADRLAIPKFERSINGIMTAIVQGHATRRAAGDPRIRQRREHAKTC